MISTPTAAPLLSGPQELALARRIERGDLAAKRTLIEANVRLVSAVAAEYRGLGVPMEDLVQEGSIGLVRAAERFDHRRELRFSTYATWWIRQAVVRGLAQARPIRLPDSANRRLRALRGAGRALTVAGAGEPTIEEAACAAGLAPGDAARLEQVTRVRSLDAPLGDTDGTLIERVADTWAGEEESGIDGELLARLVAALPAAQRTVVELSFGLTGREPVKLARIARSLGVSPERTRQLRATALQRLREGLEGASRRALQAA
jgi:RNA polymerase primary sigma factor